MSDIRRGFDVPDTHEHCETCGDCAPVVQLVAIRTCQTEPDEHRTIICEACAVFVADRFRSMGHPEHPAPATKGD